MIFTSNVFLFLFLPLFLLIYYLVKDSWRSHVIVLGSYAFYAWWRPDFLLLFVAISYWNYWFGIRIKARLDNDDKRGAFRQLTIGVVGDLATLGYFKYANFGVEVIADSLAPMSTLLMGEAQPEMVSAWFGVFISLVQLYFDFSGYSDMAIGLGMMMGFRFPENFNQPFLCQSLTEFWRRWHLTLADFLRDYIYTPIVRSRKVSANGALFLTMLLSGFWHGASFAFIFFGLYFAVFMVLERKLKLTTKITDSYNFWRNMLAVTGEVCCMPLFVTGDLSHALRIYAGMFGMNGLGSLDMYFLGTSSLTVSFTLVAVAWLVIAGTINRRYYAGHKAGYLMQNVSGFSALLLWAGFALSLTRLAANSFSPFLYFQF